MSEADQREGFLSRWSRRKVEVKQGAPALAETAGQGMGHGVGQGAAAPTSDEAAQLTPASSVAAAASAASAPAGAAAAPAEDAQVDRPSLTLDDVARLDAQSDYRAFVARDVDPEVRNAAMRKLFQSEPHFNVMDGLDVYIDDYNTPNPLPRAIMQTMLQARALGLIDDELKEQELPAGSVVVHDAAGDVAVLPLNASAEVGSAAAEAPIQPSTATQPATPTQPADPTQAS